MPNSLKKISRITFLLISISALVIFAAGFQVNSVAREIKVLKKYLENSAAVQPDFEQSIILYTTQTERVFGHLMQLRPEKEEDYVTFISNLEKIGKQLTLDLNVKSVSDGGTNSNEKKQNTISYNISFYGTEDDLKNLLSALQELPYFIRFDQVDYRNLDGMTAEEKKEPNIMVKIILYIK